MALVLQSPRRRHSKGHGFRNQQRAGTVGGPDALQRYNRSSFNRFNRFIWAAARIRFGGRSDPIPKCASTGHARAGKPESGIRRWSIFRHSQHPSSNCCCRDSADELDQRSTRHQQYEYEPYHEHDNDTSSVRDASIRAGLLAGHARLRKRLVRSDAGTGCLPTGERLRHGRRRSNCPGSGDKPDLRAVDPDSTGSLSIRFELRYRRVFHAGLSYAKRGPQSCLEYELRSNSIDVRDAGRGRFFLSSGRRRSSDADRSALWKRNPDGDFRKCRQSAQSGVDSISASESAGRCGSCSGGGRAVWRQHHRGRERLRVNAAGFSPSPAAFPTHRHGTAVFLENHSGYTV
jgi:hypothetical protein